MKRSRRHHYLPVFLLSRFAIRGSGRQAVVRCVCRGGRGREASAESIGFENNFHPPVMLFQDPEHILSGEEGVFDAALKMWQPGPLDDRGSRVADEFIVHLRIRSRTMREIARGVMNAAVNDADRAISAILDSLAPDRSLADELAASLDKVIGSADNGRAADGAQLAEEVVLPLIQRHVGIWTMGACGHLARELLRSGGPAEVLSGVHTMVILSHLLNRPRAAFQGSHWRVAEVEGGDLILGDVGPLSFGQGSPRLTTIASVPEQPLAVLLPIGPRRLLVADYGRGIRVPEPEELNEATLQLSQQFVVGVQPLKWFDERAGAIGERADEDTPERALGMATPSVAPAVEELAAQLRQAVEQAIMARWRSIGEPGREH